MKYYRCEAWTRNGDSRVTYCEFDVVSQTAFSTIIDYYGRKKRILEHRRNGRDTQKRFAWPTKEQAIMSLYFRKQKQVEILKRQLERATEELSRAEAERSDPSYKVKLLTYQQLTV